MYELKPFTSSSEAFTIIKKINSTRTSIKKRRIFLERLELNLEQGIVPYSEYEFMKRALNLPSNCPYTGHEL